MESQSPFLGEGFLRQKQQAATATVSDVPVTVATTTTTTVATTTVATVARTTVARTMMSIVPCSTTTNIHEVALSVETIKVEIEQRLGAMAKSISLSIIYSGLVGFWRLSSSEVSPFSKSSESR